VRTPAISSSSDATMQETSLLEMPVPPRALREIIDLAVLTPSDVDLHDDGVEARSTRRRRSRMLGKVPLAKLCRRAGATSPALARSHTVAVAVRARVWHPSPRSWRPAPMTAAASCLDQGLEHELHPRRGSRRCRRLPDGLAHVGAVGTGEGHSRASSGSCWLTSQQSPAVSPCRSSGRPEMTPLGGTPLGRRSP